MSRIRADQLVNRAGSGGPKFPNGVAEGFSVSGVVTATSYRGDGSQLTGIDASSLKDGSGLSDRRNEANRVIAGLEFVSRSQLSLKSILISVLGLSNTSVGVLWGEADTSRNDLRNRVRGGFTK